MHRSLHRILPALLLLAGLARVANAAPPAEAGTLLHLQPVLLDAPFRHEWRSERPQVQAGWLLVLAVEPERLRPTQLEQPVLYVGGETAERLNVGYGSGRLIAFVPAPVDPATGRPKLDAAALPIWFGTPELPERVDADRVTFERELADDAGVRPTDPALVAGLTADPRMRLKRFADREAMLREVARLIRLHAPDEEDLALILLAPKPGDAPIIRGKSEREAQGSRPEGR